jgi:hypothetical protein
VDRLSLERISPFSGLLAEFGGEDFAAALGQRVYPGQDKAIRRKRDDGERYENDDSQPGPRVRTGKKYGEGA